MTTLKGVLKLLTATNGSHSRRTNSGFKRSVLKEFKEKQKEIEIQNANYTVREWEKNMDSLKSVHKISSDFLDWENILKVAEPLPPKLITSNVDFHELRFNNYKPSFIDKLFSLTNRRLTNLKESIEQAKEKDNFDFAIENKKFQEKLLNWNQLQNLSKGVLNKDVNYYKQAMNHFYPFKDVIKLGKRLLFTYEENSINVDICTENDSIIPNNQLKLTPTGKLSTREITIAKKNELYIEHICSTVIKVAKEVFKLYTLKYITVNVILNSVNRSTFTSNEHLIISAIILPDKIVELNLDTINVVEVVKSFTHSMKFTKTKGFDFVERLYYENEINKF